MTIAKLAHWHEKLGTDGLITERLKPVEIYVGMANQFRFSFELLLFESLNLNF